MQLREAADTLGVHYQTAYAWVRQGALPARKTGRGYEVDDADVRAHAARRHEGRLPARAIGVRDWPAQADQLYAAIALGQETRARHWPCSYCPAGNPQRIHNSFRNHTGSGHYCGQRC